jgi:hypothetical protein
MSEEKLWKVGDEIDFYCKRCKLNLHGNVSSLAAGQPKAVTCRTCRFTVPFARERTEEEFRAQQLKKAFRLRDKRVQQYVDMAESRTNAASGTDVTRRWRDATDDVDSRSTNRYDRHRSYEVDDLLIHSEHGLGIVTSVLHENGCVALFRKVEVPLEMNAEREEG